MNPFRRTYDKFKNFFTPKPKPPKPAVEHFTMPAAKPSETKKPARIRVKRNRRNKVSTRGGHPLRWAHCGTFSPLKRISGRRVQPFTRKDKRILEKIWKVKLI